MAGFENVPVLMLTGLTTTPRSPAPTRPARPTSSSSPQWTVEPAGRAPALPAASSRTRIELERSKAKLARAQDLARMGSFDWRRSTLRRRPDAVARGAARARPSCPHDQLTLRGCCAWCRPTKPRVLLRMLHDTLRHGSVLTTDVPVTLVRRQRIIHVEAEPEFNEHGQMVGLHRHRAGRDRPPRRRGQDPPPGQLRRADRAAQPAPADLARRGALEMPRRLGTSARCC
jgi:hypothetical protein